MDNLVRRHKVQNTSEEPSLGFRKGLFFQASETQVTLTVGQVVHCTRTPQQKVSESGIPTTAEQSCEHVEEEFLLFKLHDGVLNMPNHGTIKIIS